MISIESEERPWGRFFVIHDEPQYKIKRIEVEPGGRLSYQYHHKRTEHWVVVQGEAIVTLNDKEYEFEEGQVVEIPVGTKHRVRNDYEDDLIFIETQTGTYFGEDDIVRLEDDYGRDSE